MIKKLLPLIYLLIVWLAFVAPYYLQNKTPFPSNYQVNHFAPWSSYEKFWGPVKNEAMPDIVDQIFPWKYLTIETYKTGQIPLWNPYSFAGNPHLANFQSAVLSPFNIIFLILPFIDAWTLMILLQPLIVGLAAFFLMRELGVSKEGSVISSVSFMFCGFITTWMTYGTISMAIAFLPVSIFAIEKSFHKLSVFSLLLFSSSISFSIFFGHFQTTLYSLIVIFLYLLYKTILSSEKKKALFVYTAFLSGILMAMPQILPSIELYLNSVRSSAFIAGGGIPLYYLLTLFSPDFFGNPVTKNDWLGNYAEWSSFVGVVAFVLALSQAVKIKKIPVNFFLLMSAVVLILAVESPVQALVGSLRIPVLSTSSPSRIIFLLSFSLAVLAGFGFDDLRDKIKKNKLMGLIRVFVPVGFLIFFIWVMLILIKPFSLDKIVIAQRNFILPTLLFIALAFLVFTYYLLRKKRVAVVVPLLIILLVSFDSLRFVQKWMPFDPKTNVYPQVPVIKAIKEKIGYGRIFGNLGNQVYSYYGFPSIEGYDPVYIQRYGEFLQASIAGQFESAEKIVARLSKRGAYTERALDLLGVTLIFHPLADTNQGWAFPVWQKPDKYQKIYKDDKFELFRNKEAFQRIKLFNDYEVIDNKEKILAKLYSDTFNYRKSLVLEKKPKYVQRNNAAVNKSTLALYTPDKIITRVETSAPAMLFLSDNYYPGWKAFVDKTEVEIFRADYAFRAIEIPAGKHEVIFEYDPFSFRLGLYMVILGLLTFVIASCNLKRGRAD